MDHTLSKMLEALGIPYKPRFTIEEVAEILGIRRDQVMHLLKRKKLVGMKSSANRWGGVFAFDLDQYIQAVNQSTDLEVLNANKPIADSNRGTCIGHVPFPGDGPSPLPVVPPPQRVKRDLSL